MDAPLLAEMKRLLNEGKAASPQEAAKHIAPKAHGHATLENKTDRLARRYRDELSK
jgi:hypothetical protein